MIVISRLLLFGVLLFGSKNVKCQNNSDSDESSLVVLPFVIPPYAFTPKVPPGPCTGNNNQIGTCLPQTACSARKGSPSGTCAKGKGICCVFLVTCRATTPARVSYFSNPGFSKPINRRTKCILTVNKANPNICQLRLDFLDFRLAPPENTGQCATDFFLFGEPDTPKICGENTGKHVYVDFALNCNSHKLIVDISDNPRFDRTWNIRVMQIPCSQRAPRGCLMNFKQTSGTVSSFNFKSSPPQPAMGVSTRQLTDLNYGVCITPALGYCCIEWMKSGDPFSFTVSGDANAVPPVSERGGMCNHNFVVIPNPKEDNKYLRTNRFCGSDFKPIKTCSKPFVLTVVTREKGNGNDVQNRGFKLNFRQTLC